MNTVIILVCLVFYSLCRSIALWQDWQYESMQPQLIGSHVSYNSRIF